MDSIILATAVVWLSAGIAFAEVVAPPRPAGVAASAADIVSKRAAMETAIADCESMRTAART